MPSPLGALGKVLVGVGALVALVGALLLLADRFPSLRLGRLPGDIAVERERFRLYFPLGTSILVSLLLTALLWIALRFLGRR
jgi:hypothetical protein